MQPQQQQYYPSPYMAMNQNYQMQPRYAATADYMQYQPQTPQLKGRPVASIDEVRAAQIDFDGSLFTFPDIANKCIYTKQIGVNGAPILNKYVLQEEPVMTVQPYVTKEELECKIDELKALMQEMHNTEKKNNFNF